MVRHPLSVRYDPARRETGDLSDGEVAVSEMVTASESTLQQSSHDNSQPVDITTTVLDNTSLASEHGHLLSSHS